ncbi:unnamed protein product [Chrysoparadoxa australica]
MIMAIAGGEKGASTVAPGADCFLPADTPCLQPLGPLENEQILGLIMSFVGGQRYLYIGGVSKGWRATYKDRYGATTSDRAVVHSVERIKWANAGYDCGWMAIHAALAMGLTNAYTMLLDMTLFSDLRAFQTLPCPKSAGVLQCYIRRSRRRVFGVGAKLLTRYRYQLYLKEGDRLIMKSRLMPALGSTFGAGGRSELNFFPGKVRTKAFGKEFEVFAEGTSPAKEVASVVYKGTFGSGPRRMEVAIPSLEQPARSNESPQRRQSLLELLKVGDSFTSWLACSVSLHLSLHSSPHGLVVQERQDNRIVRLVNKPPRWNASLGGYQLNFHGRVTKASVKNFQLVTPHDQETVLLQFGRVSKDEFSMDFRHPLSPFQAFAISLSAITTPL